MPPNTRGSTRPAQSQNTAKAPVQHSRRPATVTTHDNDQDNVSSTQADGADEEPMELFLDLMLGTPILFYVEKDVTNREHITKMIRIHGGALSSSYTTVNYILVDPTSEAGHNLFIQFQNKKGKVILDARWVTACVQAKKLITYKGDWAGFRVKGHERSLYLQNPGAYDDADAEPPPVAEAHVANNVAPHLPKPVPDPPRRPRTPPNPPPTRSQVDTVSTVQTTPQSHQQGSVTDSTQSTPLVDPSRPSPGNIYYAAPLPGVLYHYPPQFTANAHHFRPHVVAHPGPAPAPWAPIAMPFPAAAPMFAPIPPQAVPSAQHQRNANVNPTPAHPQPIPAAIPYAAFDYSQQAGYAPPTAPPTATAWYEYYPHMPPDLYQRSAADLATYGVGIPIHQQSTTTLNGSPRNNATAGPSGSSQPDPSAAAGEEEGSESSPPRRTRGRTKVRSINQSGARINVKATAPFTRSPTPPTRIVKSTYGGNLFTEEDVEYLRKYMAYCQEQGVLLSLREICERLAVRAPHHTFFSWRRYCNKHQIRLGGYNLDTQDEEGDGGDDQEALEEENTAGPSGISAELGKRKRTGSPIPPKILYKSTTGKGVAFTTADVQYLLDYLKYRREQNPALDMVEFWNDIAERAPHHSRASWMKYWRRHKHELEPQTDGSVQAPYIPVGKKSRYTKEDDILLAKYFFVNQRPPSNAPGATGLANPIPGKTSDAIFQEFAKLHPQHPWKGWQEHHRLHKREIDLMIKKLEDGEEI